jgi:hypothetical protein
VELIGLYLVASYLLVAAGLGKAIRPDATARALAALPVNRWPVRWVQRLVRVGSLAELSLGLVGLAFPGSGVAWLVAASYAAFAAVVAMVRSSGGSLASCGCFGTPDTPATTVHVAVDVALCAAATGVAVAHPAGSMLRVLAHQPAAGVPLVAVSALAAWLAYLAVSALSDLQAARAVGPGHDRTVLMKLSAGSSDR